MEHKSIDHIKQFSKDIAKICCLKSVIFPNSDLSKQVAYFEKFIAILQLSIVTNIQPMIGFRIWAK